MMRRPSLRRLSLLACLAGAIGCTTDLRPEVIEEGGITEASAAEARAWVDRMIAAHGGLDAWMAHRDATVVLTDTWPGWLTRTAAMPWPDDGQKMALSLLLGTDDARLDFVGGEWDGRAWGVQHWQTWQADKGGAPVFEPDDDVKFWVPTVAYFFALPFRIGEASVLGYGGERVIDGRPHAVVYATWGSAEPQDDIDQYVLYIDQETHRLTWSHFTVRDLVLADAGAVHYTDMREVEGIVVPFEMRIVGDVGGDDTLHVMAIESVDFGAGHPDDFYRPDPSRRGSK